MRRSIVCSKSNVVYDAGVKSIQGRRDSMEDTFSFTVKFLLGMSLIFRTIRIRKIMLLVKHTELSIQIIHFIIDNIPKDDMTYSGVFDGHGGDKCSDYCKKQFHHNLARELSFRYEKTGFKDMSLIRDSFVSSHLMTQLQLRKQKIMDGTTAVTTFIHNDYKGDRWLHTGHVGDSVAILCQNIKDTPTEILLTPEHRPSLESESKRIIDSGGHIFHNRVMGVLAITRALGDIKLKREGVTGISHTPDVTSVKLDKSHMFLVMCSDGVTDVLNPKQIIQICYGVYEHYKKSSKHICLAKKMARHLVELAKKHSSDNITAMVIIL